MIVVLGDEESQIDNSNPYIQARMQRHSLHKRFIVDIQSSDELHSLLPKPCENTPERVRVVIGLVRLAILHVAAESVSLPAS